MKLTTVLAGLAAASLSTATPLEKRQIGGVSVTVLDGPTAKLGRTDTAQILICNGADATGNCTHEVYEMGRCYNMTSEFSGNVATFAPDGGPWYCYPYM